MVEVARVYRGGKQMKCFVCGSEDWYWLGDGYDCPFNDCCEQCWEVER